MMTARDVSTGRTVGVCLHRLRGSLKNLEVQAVIAILL
jgi:hypothetical protein